MVLLLVSVIRYSECLPRANLYCLSWLGAAFRSRGGRDIPGGSRGQEREEAIVIRHTTYTPAGLSPLPLSAPPSPRRSMGSLKSLPPKLFIGGPQQGRTGAALIMRDNPLCCVTSGVGLEVGGKTRERDGDKCREQVDETSVAGGTREQNCKEGGRGESRCRGTRAGGRAAAYIT